MTTALSELPKLHFSFSKLSLFCVSMQCTRKHMMFQCSEVKYNLLSLSSNQNDRGLLEMQRVEEDGN